MGRRAEAAGEGAGGAWAEPLQAQQVAVRLMGGHSESSLPKQGSARPRSRTWFHTVHPAIVHQAELAGPGASLPHICDALGNGDLSSGQSCSCQTNDKVML